MSDILRQLRQLTVNYHERPSDDGACYQYSQAANEYFEKLISVAEAAKSAKDMLLNIEYNHIERSIEAVAILYEPLLRLDGHDEGKKESRR